MWNSYKQLVDQLDAIHGHYLTIAVMADTALNLIPPQRTQERAWVEAESERAQVAMGALARLCDYYRKLDQEGASL